ncbi:uncharacterized protein K452DRAFT_91007 [Aplosporella prunicola CBS 121167]|uniref:Zn(2)-C6 fungal-type domain-containing protein n=1 Tax=Aplosporella prunicola CBS 121167 TaxID=1176127 RepID=A0A6A6B222_9PEZI|nr:uncharacterized protein K452DRAFT_91007 [Aplosporella prunicola CBS 121167]KAF2138262.1 hypothetical protein K452DRAFT_91007 [Aplosporella prunicola CBS 121167]
MPVAKRPAPSEGASPSQAQSPKLPKTEHHAAEDFSHTVKKKLSASTRTGQACDRCKVRKIRCDGRPGGCSPCIQNNTECKTTDRITGRATIRGHTEAIEYENVQLKQALYQMQAQLKELGVEPKVIPAVHSYAPTPQPAQNGWPTATADGHLWGSAPPANTNAMTYPPASSEPTSANDIDSTQFRTTNLPTFRSGLNGDNYLGVSSANSVLSPIKGTSLSFYGMEIDLADFVPDDVEDISSPMSYRHFLAVAMNASDRPKPHKVDLPSSHQECETYASWYFRGLHPYTPVLYKPHFMDLLSRIYSNVNHTTTIAETVMVQMVLAIIKYQFAARNNNPEAQEQSNAHFRWSLSHFYQLLSGHTLEDIQALTMICLHLRNFPKPGAAWMMSSLVLSVAVEMGLHRSAKAWAETAPKRDIVEIETRKRVFWTLHALHITLSGKLGRPMPLRMEDIDVEFPEAIRDNLPSEESLSEFRKCSFHIGLQGIKIVALSSQMYSSIYAVRQLPQSYEPTLRRLEEEHRRWREQVPPELREGSRVDAEDHIFALYVQFWDQEFSLMLHHPALSRSSDQNLLKRNMDICLEANSKMVKFLDEIRRYKSLDTPWINCTVYLAAILTQLFVYSHRKDEITSSDLANLKIEMEMWLLIMEECGSILGSGKRLEEATRVIIDKAIGNISRHLAKKTASAAAAVANAALKQSPSTSPRQDAAPAPPPYPPANGYGNQYSGAISNNAPVTDPSKPSYMPPDDPSMTQSSHPYPAVAGAPQYSPYANGPHSMSTYQNGDAQYSQSPYGVPGSDMTAAHAAAAVSAGTTQDNGMAFAYPQPPHSAPPHQNANPQNQSDAWRQWMMTNLGSQEYHPASALMALGHTGPHSGRDGSVSGVGGMSNSPMANGVSGASGPQAGTGTIVDMEAAASVGMHQQHQQHHPHPAVSAAAVAQAAQAQGQLWPLMVFDIGQQSAAGTGQ